METVLLHRFSTEESVTEAPGLPHVAGLEAQAHALLGVVGQVDGVVAPPCAVVVPEVMVRGEFLFGLVTRTSLGISASQATVVFSFPGWHPDPPTRPQEFLMLPLLYYKSATMKSLACVIKAKRAFRPSLVRRPLTSP
jgi:hypothetical protein